ncbi:anti-sigma28 factor (negative regulator of flagellin synthesis) [Nocardiopsis arvandica]|uniref:Anti-sigma28 factor (Negative regulator of flagellin synthesis) n=1 Tax=Nocardiopsis sinuspersici TaxID=501010 RepID=A0A7Y9XBK2_9ACTN|nr:hypothetical protein [Nocardiopsis sinuspersici]NYH52796.1 anti-sigma28 factor (negative regulator of flagellin synthesis) [Nocardiopsis sinuspersici]
MTSQQGTTSDRKQDRTPDQVAAELQRKRRLAAAKDTDALERLRERTERQLTREQIRHQAAQTRRDRRADQSRGRAAAALERARLAAEINQSAEARALRVQRTRTLSLAVLLPVLAAFAAWSTTGVHSGATTLLSAERWGAVWWALWLLEPALIGTVGWIIIVRARLASAGGRLGQDALRIMWGCLAVSVALNAIGHWPTTPESGWTFAAALAALGALLAHSLGPVGAAMTAHLVGVIEDAITAARPWEGAKTLAELADDSTRHHASESAGETAPTVEVADRSRLPERALEVPAGAVRLPVVRCGTPTSRKASKATPKNSQRSAADQAQDQVSEAPAKPRADKGKTLPKSAKPSAAKQPVRALSDEDLLNRLDQIIAAGELPEGTSVRRVQTALGCGFDRAKRVLSMREERTETTVPERLAVVPAARSESAA